MPALFHDISNIHTSPRRLPHQMLRCCFVFIVLIALLIPQSGFAQQQWQTSKYLEMAREALALGEMVKWEKALKMADKAFESEKARMSFSERNNQKLWITLFWSKYHQFRGNLPPVKKASDFESIKALKAHTDKVEKSIEHLKKGMRYLRSYNLMYMQVAQRSNVQNQIYLQASLSLERDLQGTIRQGKIYAAFLRFVRTNWNDKKALKKKLGTQEKTLTVLKKKQQKTQMDQETIRKEQKKLAVVVKKAQTDYAAVQANLQRQASTATALTWGGVIGMVLGGAGIGVGVYLIADADARKDTMTVVDRQRQTDAGLYTIIGSAAVFVLAAAATLTGVVINPGKIAKDKAVLGAQNKYLDVERNKLKPTSSLWPRKGQRTLPHLPPQHEDKAVVLGSW